MVAMWPKTVAPIAESKTSMNPTNAINGLGPLCGRRCRPAGLSNGKGSCFTSLLRSMRASKAQASQQIPMAKARMKLTPIPNGGMSTLH